MLEIDLLEKSSQFVAGPADLPGRLEYLGSPIAKERMGGQLLGCGQIRQGPLCVRQHKVHPAPPAENLGPLLGRGRKVEGRPEGLLCLSRLAGRPLASPSASLVTSDSGKVVGFIPTSRARMLRKKQAGSKLTARDVMIPAASEISSTTPVLAA